LFDSAIQLLKDLAKKIKEKGVRSADVVPDLTALYGSLEAAGSDVELVNGIREMVVAGMVSQSDVEPPALEAFSEGFVKLIDREIARLDKLLMAALENDVMHNSRAALILPEKDLERIIRYDTHLSRQIERTLRLFMSLQARRRVLPTSTINLDLNTET
jgi:hypothetical protein